MLAEASVGLARRGAGFSPSQVPREWREIRSCLANADVVTSAEISARAKAATRYRNLGGKPRLFVSGLRRASSALSDLSDSDMWELLQMIRGVLTWRNGRGQALYGEHEPSGDLNGHQ